MGTLGKIRNQTGLLLAVIGFAMLAFILGDFLKSTNSGGGSMYVGEVLGEDISIQIFQKKVDEGIDNWKNQNPQAILNQTTIAQVRDGIWDQYVRELIMVNEFDKLGIDVSDEEWMERISGVNVHSEVSQVPAFQDANTGLFDRAKVLTYLKQIDQDQTGDARRAWIGFQKYLINLIKTKKYNTLVSKAMFTTTDEARIDVNANIQKAIFNYVAIPFVSIDQIEPTQKELVNYYDAHKSDYPQEASKDVDFVVYTVVPSLEDDEETKNLLADLVNDFESSEDYELIARRESDNTNARFLFASVAEFQDPKFTELFNADRGKVIGPYMVDRGVYRIAKLAEVEYRPDSVKARHILLTPNQTMSLDSVNKRINTLKLAIEGGANFADLARKNSEDQGSAIKGGDLGWFPEGRMVNEFNEACFTSKKGDLSVITSQYGVHLIEVTNTSKAIKKAKIAYIDRIVEPSTETFNSYYTQAAQFAGNILNDGEDFDTLIEKNNLVKRSDSRVIAEKQDIVGLPNSREMIKWMYNTGVGSVSEVFQFDNSYVVAIVTKEYDEGVQPLEDIKEQITSLLVKDKKASKIISGITSSDLSSIADANSVEVISNQKATFSNVSIQGIGADPKLVGSIFAASPGKVSAPIIGKDAVYIIEVISIDEAKSDQDFSNKRLQMQKQSASYTNVASYNVLKEAADIVDNRVDFF